MPTRKKLYDQNKQLQLRRAMSRYEAAPAPLNFNYLFFKFHSARAVAAAASEPPQHTQDTRSTRASQKSVARL